MEKFLEFIKSNKNIVVGVAVLVVLLAGVGTIAVFAGNSGKSEKSVAKVEATEEESAAQIKSESKVKESATVEAVKVETTTDINSDTATTESNNKVTSDNSIGTSSGNSTVSTGISSNSSNTSSANSSNTSSNSGNTSSHEHTWVDQTKVVHHEATGHNETVVVQAAYDEQVPVYEYQVRTICNKCGADITDEDLAVHSYQCHASYHNQKVQIQTGTQAVHHEAVTENRWVQDSPAYDETVVTGQICSGCGATK